MSFLPILLLAAIALAQATWASSTPQDEPGYVDFAALDLIDEAAAEATIEIYLKDPLLGLVAAATRFEDEELADMLGALHLIRVQAYEQVDIPYQEIADRLKGFTLPGWEQVVRVREQEEQVQVYVRVAEEDIVGLLVLACESSQFVLINIVGPIDLAQVGRIGRKFDLDPLDSLDEIDFEADSH